MKNQRGDYLIVLAFIFLCLTSTASNAERTVLTGKPTSLVAYPGYYMFPQSYVADNDRYHFIEIGGVRRVCFMNPQANLKKLDSVQITIDIDDALIQWICYRYTPKYFEIDY